LRFQFPSRLPPSSLRSQSSSLLLPPLPPPRQLLRLSPLKRLLRPLRQQLRQRQLRKRLPLL
jgi:hypothetical protein